MSPARSGECPHPHPSPIGCAQAPIDRADASVAGLIVHTALFMCPDCEEVLMDGYLGPKRGAAVLAAETLLVLRRRGVRHG